MLFGPLDHHHSAGVAVSIENHHFDVATLEVSRDLAGEFPALGQ